MKKIAAVFLLIVTSMLFIAVFSSLLNPSSNPESFYVGVTYCGQSVEEAKLLIDRVKNYTNLFVLQSGPLQEFPDKINEICDYAVFSGMYFIVYFGVDKWLSLNNWLETCEDRWDDRFLGVYYGDELGGKMIDHEAYLWDGNTNSPWLKYHDGSVQGSVYENATIRYWSNGRIQLSITEPYDSLSNNDGLPDPSFLNHTFYTWINYYPNGTIITEISDDFDPIPRIVEDYNVTYSYSELMEMHPFQSYDEVADGFIEHQHQILLKGPKKDTNISSFLADYALYWFDYEAGYDVLFASLGWNHTMEQDIALVRGAANLQNKSWGAIVTWKYNQPPYLDSGNAIYEQIRSVYQCGGEYVVIFNYAENMTGTYGTLKEEHFVALERFWNEVVQNPFVKHGSITAEAVLVLPENYGWGMRTPNDKIWGLWGPDEKSLQIWELSRNLLEQYGLSLDIIYDESEFPVKGEYGKIFYWNQKV